MFICAFHDPIHCFKVRSDHDLRSAGLNSFILSQNGSPPIYIVT